MDGWMTCNFTSFLTVFQSYHFDVWMIMRGCVQWNSVYGWEDFTSSEDRTRSARSVGQRLTHWAIGAPPVSIWPAGPVKSCFEIIKNNANKEWGSMRRDYASFLAIHQNWWKPMLLKQPSIMGQITWVNSADPDQTAPRSSLIWVYAVYQSFSLWAVKVHLLKCLKLAVFDCNVGSGV